jgi:valyl-tRNA synthetase
LNTAISDIEVEKVLIKERKKIKIPNYKNEIEVGVLHTFSYKIENSDKFINVSTTRIGKNKNTN